MNNKTRLFSLFLLATIFAVGLASATTLAQWTLTTDGSASNVDSNINAGAFTAGSGLSAITFTADGATTSGWTTAATKDTNDYYQIALSPKTGYDLIINSINFGERRTLDGIRNYTVEWSKNSDFSSATTIATIAVPDDVNERISNITGLNININNGETIYLRVFGYSAESAVGSPTWRVNDNTLNIEGTTSISLNPTYCKLGEKGSIITIKKVSDEQKDNKDEWKWRPLDNIELTVEVENNDADYDLDGIIEYGLYDTDDEDFIFEDEMDFDVDADKKDEFTITFKIDPTELNQDTSDGNYQFYIKVYDDDDYDEETQCKQFIQDVEIKRNKDEIILEDGGIKILPEQVGCGSEVEVVADLYNIGTEDQEGVYAILYNQELGLNLKQDIGDIDATEKQSVKFTFKIPQTAEEKSYYLELMIYDEDDDIYEYEDAKGDDKESRYSYTLNVNGNCLVAPQASVTASVVSGGQAGKELVVKTIIKNDGTKTATYTLTASGYESWAILKETTPSVLVLNAGESSEVTYKFNVNKDTVGENTFNIVVKTGETAKEKLEQPFSVTIQESKGFSLPGFSGSAIAGDNWYLWGIGALNVILIIIIIIVAIRVAKS